MASNLTDPAIPPTGSDGFPPNQPKVPGPPSIISSRMTDIASDDGRDDAPNVALDGGGNESDRPSTARTGGSSKRGGRAVVQPLRKSHLSALSTKRASVGGQSVTGTGTGSGTLGRSGSTKSRNHVPSLTSHVFFHPMSSQKLQAQRASRPVTQSRLAGPDTTPGELSDLSQLQQNADSPVGAHFAPQTSDDGEVQPPPSRGTEMTGLETIDRRTANTSPSFGHFPQGSQSDSVRPLQANRSDNNKNLRVDVTRRFDDRGKIPSPMRTPRSFRSSFLLPSKMDSAQTSTARNMQGAEKLSSVASSPRLDPADIAARQKSAAQAADPKKHAAAKTALGRVYQYFDGNTVFCLGGRWQNARHRPVNIATGLFVLVPGVLFFVFSAPWLWHNISPAIPITFGYLFYICFSSFVHASVSDPGILPRNLHTFPSLEEDADPLRLGPPTNDWVLIKSADSSAAAMEVPVKHCRTCNIWRPPRAHHCRLCDNCIETHDHHCVWLNNCVGRRNYRYFFTFVSSASFLSAYLTGASLAQVLIYRSQENISFGAAIDHFRVPFAMAIFGVLGLLYPVALMGYHIFLMARGETTREYINSHKFVKKERYRAFSQGNFFKNWLVVLCRPKPPSYYSFKNRYSPGDQRLGARRGQRAHGSSSSIEMNDVNKASSFHGPTTLGNTAN